MWRELLELKDFRERQAQTALQRRRSELALAQAALERALARLQQHRELARTHERSLYDGLMRRTVRLRDIEDVQHSVAALRLAEQRLQLDSVQAEGSRGQAQQATREALARHRRSERAKEKFVQLASLHHAELLREAERAEDLEMEEVAALRRDREDWGAAEDGS